MCCLQIKDIEKIIRKIIHKKASPADYYNLFECGKILLDIFLTLDIKIKNHVEEERTIHDIKIIHQRLNLFFNMESCKHINSTQFDKLTR